MATYVNDLRLKEIGTGEESGTWGTSTNTNLELIGEALGYGTQDCFSSDADATTTVADGSTDPARAMYFKVTSSATLSATRTLTIAPNTISRVMFIENATTGSQSINISQGSGANVTIATGKTAVVYLDGAGSGAAVVDAMALVDPGVTDTLAEVLTAGNTSSGTNIELTTTDKVQLRDSAIYINSSTDGQLDIVADTEVQIAATTIDINGNVDISGTTVSAGKITADAGIDIDNINIDGTTIALSSGDLTLDVAADINLDAGGDSILFKSGGTHFGDVTKSGNDLYINAVISDGDIYIRGNDGGSTINALQFDMSAAGAATFNDKITAVGTSVFTNLDISGDIDVDGTTNLDVVDIDGAVDMASTLTVADDLAVDTDTLFVDASADRVGIGTTSPSNPLHIKDSNPTIRLEDSDGSGAGIAQVQNTANGNLRLIADPNDDGSSSSSIEFEIDGTEIARFRDTGRLGINTSSPGFELDVQAATDPSIQVKSTGTGDSDDAFMRITIGGTSASSYLMFGDSGDADAGRIRYHHSTNKMSFRTNDSERVYIDSSGNMGIGVTSPAYNLDVDSTIHIGNDGGTGFTHSRLIMDANGSARGEGMFLHNQDDDVEYFVGRPYNKIDSFAVTRQATSAHADSTADVSRALLVLNSSGNLGLGDDDPADRLTVSRLGASWSGAAPHAGTAAFIHPGGTAAGSGVVLTIAGNSSATSSVYFSSDSDNDVGQINYLFSANAMTFFNGGSERMRIDSSGNILPGANNSQDLGSSSKAFDDVYTYGTVNPSDRNLKQDIEVLSDAEQRVAVACKGLLRKYRMKSSVAEKGDDARIHFGIIAQDLQAAFEAEGLDAGRYAMFTSNTSTDEETGEEHTRLGVRYSELLAFIISAI